ncbi:MAG: hypothetical protein HUU56_11955 [Bdellovibrionaceae bacterium]|nr:hypothetical protein [Pseudobdellovibrionaceae bacterium]
MRTELIETVTGYQINMIGRLDLLKTNFLREVLIKDFKNKRIVFNFSSLSFVGSNGILLFFAVINDLYMSHQIQSEVIGLSEDFKKIVIIDKYPHLKFDFVNQGHASLG